LIVDWRFNIVGKRKAPQTNIWLQKYENGYAPAYWKANLAVDYKISHTIKLQFLVYNVFNEQYYGVGRETGRGFVDDYNYQTNINPAGFSPAYHPQPGRTIYFNLTFSFF
jgi:outer membrane receptor protein involved in Fe transport